MSHSGELDLQKLLHSMNPLLHDDIYVFISIPPTEQIPDTLERKMSFAETEGTTVIATQAAAEAHKIPFVFPSKMISLRIHSSLEAVGFLAAILGHLKDLGIGVNPVSGFYHDHLFVPLGREDEVMDCLRQLSHNADVET